MYLAFSGKNKSGRYYNSWLNILNTKKEQITPSFYFGCFINILHLNNNENYFTDNALA